MKVYAIISAYESNPDAELEPIAYSSREKAIAYLYSLCDKYNTWCRKSSYPEQRTRMYKVDETEGTVYYKYINSANRVSCIVETWIKELEVE